MIKKIFTRLNTKVPGILGVYMFFSGLVKIPWFIKSYLQFRASEQKTSSRFSLTARDILVNVFDNTKAAPFDPHYTYHPAWAARILAKTQPEKHVDIGSIMEFATLVSAFVPVEFYDYRPAAISLSNFTSGRADLLSLPFADNSIPSLSCMHTIEHVGLGRYGDAIDYDGDRKAIAELIRVLAPGGTLIFVTPVGAPRIQFNGHRIYSYEQIIEYFDGLDLTEFSLLPDSYGETGIIINAEPSLVAKQRYACGCFVFTKPEVS